MHPKDISVFEYLYRDASNYKTYGKVLLSGRARPTHMATIASALIDGEYFLPSLVGLPDLTAELFAYSNGPTEDDHEWHEYIDLRAANAEEVVKEESVGDLEDFVARFAISKLATSMKRTR